MSDRLLVSTRKGLFTFDRAAPGYWAITRTAFLGDPVLLTLTDARTGHWFASLYHGHFGSKIQRSEDGGQTWNEIAAPAYPPKPDDCDDKDMWGKPLEWKLDRIWALEAGHREQPGVLWAGTQPGGLFRSADNGDSWELVRSLWDHPLRKKWMGGGADLPGIHSICVDPRDGNRVTVGVSTGGVWQTTDGGHSWDPRADGMWAEYAPPESKFDPVGQDVHRIVQCPARPDHYWVQHHNGIFRSTNDCASWLDITPHGRPSPFGFAVVVHPADPETAWFVPAVKDEKRYPKSGEVVVSRTRDGGQTFDVLREGLPQVHAYDLVYRHALDVDGTGQRLAFGSTTGSLWISEDGGESWQTLSNHLPPVYGVQFARG